MKKGSEQGVLSICIKKMKAINFLGGKCKCCNESNFLKLSFHHVNPDEKEEKVANIFGRRWSFIEKEIKKCVILCHNCHVEEHFKDKLKYQLKKTRASNNKKILLEFVDIKKCFCCGYNKCMAALEFHHINREEKEFDIGDINKILKNVYELEKNIIDEINKCVILCKNCHSLETVNVSWYEKNMNKILNGAKKYKEIQKKINREEVYKMYNNGMMQKDIAIFFKASNGTISDILKPLKHGRCR